MLTKIYIVFGILVCIFFVYVANRGANIFNAQGFAFATTRSGPDHK